MLLPDDLMVGQPGCLAQMVAAYDRAGGNIVCAQEVPRERTASYGIVTPGAQRRPADRGQGPGRKAAARRTRPPPSPWSAATSSSPRSCPSSAQLGKGAGGEIQLTDGMAALIGKQSFHALTFDGERHDCGDPKGFVLANLALALGRDDLAPALRAWLAERG